MTICGPDGRPWRCPVPPSDEILPHEHLYEFLKSQGYTKGIRFGVMITIANSGSGGVIVVNQNCEPAAMPVQEIVLLLEDVTSQMKESLNIEDRSSEGSVSD